VDAERAVIVGGGILGTMHAIEACRRGWEVVHLEADAGPRRASVRNFGLIWISGRAGGAELELALRARARWAELARDSPGIGFRPDGSITVASDEAELALMAEAAERADAPARGYELLDAEGVAKVNPSVRGRVAGGLWCHHDAVVEPGLVLESLRSGLEATGRYRWLPGHRAVEVTSGGPRGGEGPTVIDHHGGSHHGSMVMLCIGDRLNGIGGRVGATLASAPLRRCRLQMMETAPLPERLPTALADGDSMRYYPAFDLPARRSMPPPPSDTVRWGMQLLLVQRATGGLTIGDTHVYEEPFDFALDEAPFEELRRRAERILGRGLPPVVRRWAGVYTVATDDRLYYREEVDPGVWVVTGPAGRGMTLSPAIAAETWEAVAA
jgi:FAD dependent oxidoreductase TIGR03364